jgi:hypothetical protein
MNVGQLKQILEGRRDDEEIYAPLFTSKSNFLYMNDDFDPSAMTDEEWRDIVIEAEEKDDEWFVQGQDILRQTAHSYPCSPFYEISDGELEDANND